MKYIIKSISFVILLVNLGSAQIVSSVSLPERLGVDGFAQGPVLSPDGKRLAFSREQYNGVEIWDFASATHQRVCTHLGAGWGMTWLDSKTLIVRSTKEGTTFRNRQMGVEQIDIMTLNETVIVPFTPSNRIEIPRKSSTGSVAVWNNQRLSVIKPDKSVLQKKTVQVNEALPSFEEGKILSGTKTIETPGRRAVLSMVWSPDGSKALVELLGQPSLFLMNRSTGKFLTVAHNGEHPSWITNELFVYMETRDDGHQVVSGEIILATVDGAKQNLTERFEPIALNPSASSDGKVAFSTMNGQLYILKLEL